MTVVSLRNLWKDSQQDICRLLCPCAYLGLSRDAVKRLYRATQLLISRQWLGLPIIPLSFTLECILPSSIRLLWCHCKLIIMTVLHRPVLSSSDLALSSLVPLQLLPLRKLNQRRQIRELTEGDVWKPALSTRSIVRSDYQKFCIINCNRGGIQILRSVMMNCMLSAMKKRLTLMLSSLPAPVLWPVILSTRTCIRRSGCPQFSLYKMELIVLNGNWMSGNST